MTTSTSNTTAQPTLDRQTAESQGMALAYFAQLVPDGPAVISPTGNRSFKELNARVNQLAHLFRAYGLKAGDGIAIICSNRTEFVEVYYASMRSGLRFTPINWHLTAHEAGYILDNCEAKLVFGDVICADVCAGAINDAPRLIWKLAIGGDIPGFESYEAAIAGQPDHDVSDPSLGNDMLYTSGTTGKPKGVFRRKRPGPSNTSIASNKLAAFVPGKDLMLVPGPIYHSAGLHTNLHKAIINGIGAVIMPKWDPEEALKLIERHRITHAHMVPTMFHRLLNLPDEVRTKYDVSSLRWLIHGAAPCPVDLKKKMLDWLGPIIVEYYGSTEGVGVCIMPDQWLRKPGSVGCLREDNSIEIRNPDGKVAAPGETGYVYFHLPEEVRFEYFKSPEKTTATFDGDYYTVGDIGYVDEDGFLFLVGRDAETIISNGVNIYPQEIDDVLALHPAVLEACTVGIPDSIAGETVHSAINLKPGVTGNDELAEELIAFTRSHLAAFKCPRSVEFVREALPRLQAGKILRNNVRAWYWPKK
ncbi:MAG: AMP-binding protein [Parvibaculum sp.]|uniref:AMP-binding protein n=1 Tax=Parvibaculum sp. TaxID=2024848 RepID=UPI003C785DC1